MIRRIWHGWTTGEKARAYEELLRQEIFVHIHGRRIKGYRGIELIKRNTDSEVEFVTLMLFDNLEAVKQFAGEDYAKAVVPEKAQKLLSRYDRVSQHYEVIEERKAETL